VKNGIFGHTVIVMFLERKWWYRFQILTVSASPGSICFWGVSTWMDNPFIRNDAGLLQLIGASKTRMLFKSLPLSGLLVVVSYNSRGLEEKTLYVANSKNEDIF
jgi:hypothetical protein